MKSSLKKLRGLALHHHKHDSNHTKTILPLGQRDELAQATRVLHILSLSFSLLLHFLGFLYFTNFNFQEMQDMRDCYDTLLSAAAATASSAYGIHHSYNYYLFQFYIMHANCDFMQNSLNPCEIWVLVCSRKPP